MVFFLFFLIFCAKQLAILITLWSETFGVYWLNLPLCLFLIFISAFILIIPFLWLSFAFIKIVSWIEYLVHLFLFFIN